MYMYALVKLPMSMISMILHKAEAKPSLSVNIKDIQQMQVGFNAFYCD